MTLLAKLPTRPALPLALRREQLLLRSAALRSQLALDAQALAAPLAVADRLRDGARWLRRHPEWPLGAVLLLLALRPRRALRWAVRAGWLWRQWQAARRLLALLAAPR